MKFADDTLRPFTVPRGLSPFLELVAPDSIELAKGRGRLVLTVANRHLRPQGIMHGGVLATILDSVLGLASGTLAPADHHVVTVQLNVNFLRPAWEGEKLIATSEVQHAGKQTAVSRGEVRTEKGVLVGAGSGTFMYLPFPPKDKSKMEKLDDSEVRRTPF